MSLLEEKHLMELNAKFEHQLSEKEQEITRLTAQTKSMETTKQQEIVAAVAQIEAQRQKDIAEKDKEIMRLRESERTAELVKQMAVTEAVRNKDKEISDLNHKVEQIENAAKIRELNLQDKHKAEVQRLEEALAQSKDFKQRLSTKMLGETLEQHCLIAFNRIRADAFPNAVFGKDNESVEHTKGDFILRESTDDGIEFISIMFEMKNEAEETVKKQKNTKFLQKLDEDRKKKNCEYAVLVTTLEPDSEYYNDGIVTAYQYDKMFIIRPQFFLPLISLLRRTALSNVATLRELATIQRQNLDVQKFDATLAEFKDQFGKNCDHAQKHFANTIKEITETIKHLEKVKAELEATGKQLNLANNKAQDLTIKKLTKGNIGMQQKFLDAGVEVA